MSIFPSWNPPDWPLVWGLNVLWQTTCIALLSLVAAGLCGRRAVIRHGIHCGSLVLLLLVPPMALVMQSSGWTWFAWPAVELRSGSSEPPTVLDNRLPSTKATQAGPSSSPALSSRDAADPSPSAVSGSDADRTSDAAAGGNLRSGADAPTATIASRMSEPPVAPAAGSDAGLLRRGLVLFLFAWLVGSTALLSGTLVRWIRLTSLLRRSRAATCETIRGAFTEACRAMGVRQPPGLLLSSTIDAPFAAGLRRPSVVLPEAIVANIDSEQLRQILVHELAHILRRDPLIVLVQNIVGGLYWLHPLVRVLNRRLAQAREEVCDNHVLAIAEPPAYGRTLLYLAGRTRIVRPLGDTVGLLTTHWRLETRIAGILDDRRDPGVRMTPGSRLLVCGFLLAALSLAAVGTISSTSQRSDADLSGSGSEPRDQIAEEKIALLDKIAAATRTSWESIKSFEGSGTYSASWAWPFTPVPGKSRLERRASIRLAFDREGDRLAVDWEDREPPWLTGDDPPSSRAISGELNRFRSVLDAKEWLDLRTSSRFATTEAPLLTYDSSSRPRVLVIHHRVEDRVPGPESEGLIDPREWISMAGRYVGFPRPYFWEEHEWLKQLREKARREGKADETFRLCDVIREETDTGSVITVRHDWGTRRRTLVFEERYGYALTRCEHALGTEVEEVAEIGYRRLGDLAVPFRFVRKVTGQPSGWGRIPGTLEVLLNRIEANQPLEPATFSPDRLELRDGDRVLSLRRNARFVIEDGKRVAVDKDQNVFWIDERELQGITSLNGAIFGHRGWDGMLRRREELFQDARGIGKLPQPERKAAYAKHREACEALGRWHLAMEPYHWTGNMNSFDNLGQVVSMEFAGPVADEAAQLLVRSGELRKAEQETAWMLAYSSPTSLAADTMLRGMIDQSTSRGTQAQARMSLARVLTKQAERKRMVEAQPHSAAEIEEKYGSWYLQRLKQVDPHAAEREAEALYEEVIEKYADVNGRISPKEKLADQARRDLKALRDAAKR